MVRNSFLIPSHNSKSKFRKIQFVFFWTIMYMYIIHLVFPSSPFPSLSHLHKSPLTPNSLFSRFSTFDLIL